MQKQKLVIDCEVYKNYFLLAAKNIATGNVFTYEMHEGQKLNRAAILKLMRSCLTISFNGFGYDVPIITHALNGASCADLKKLSDEIIVNKVPVWRLADKYDLANGENWDHIDLVEVAPGRSSLKIYGGRLNAKKLQDLPVDPSAKLTPEQMKGIKSYCENDLDLTILLYENLKKAVELRSEMSKQYGMDLRSKSDAQIAETVIKSELEARTRRTYTKPKSLPNSFKYIDPKIISYKSENLKTVFKRILSERFKVADTGAVIMPDWLKDERVVIDGKEYQMGIGGLHSCEKSQFVDAGADHLLFDLDVASYYPNIILQQGLAPESLGKPFLDVYESLVNRRLKAKREGDKVAADTLKIAVNGSFGKLGSKYSFLYSPDLLIQTTITGQLALLMLIERVTATGAKVVSANTDGIVCYLPRELERSVEAVAFDWQLDTSFILERTDYRRLASRDVNNYIAVKLDGGTKGKGCFAKLSVSKNPDCRIVYKAVAEKVANSTPIKDTILNSKDLTDFVTVRQVAGGAVWRDSELGRAVRFYYSTEVPETETIKYLKNGNTVPKSQGAKPVMDLPDTFPTDIDYTLYITEAEKLLCEVGHK